jgi:hypothetical protein
LAGIRRPVRLDRLQVPPPSIVHFKSDALGEEEECGPSATVRVINGSIWMLGEIPELIAQHDQMLNIWHMVSRPAVGMPLFTIEQG